MAGSAWPQVKLISMLVFLWVPYSIDKDYLGKPPSIHHFQCCFIYTVVFTDTITAMLSGFLIRLWGLGKRTREGLCLTLFFNVVYDASDLSVGPCTVTCWIIGTPDWPKHSDQHFQFSVIWPKHLYSIVILTTKIECFGQILHWHVFHIGNATSCLITSNSERSGVETAIHPQSIPLNCQGQRVVLDHIPACNGHNIAYTLDRPLLQDIHTFTPRYKLHSLINLTCRSLEGWRKPMRTQGEHATWTQKRLSKATVLPTSPPCCSRSNRNILNRSSQTECCVWSL